jgi:hypothetical protein
MQQPADSDLLRLQYAACLCCSRHVQRGELQLFDDRYRVPIRLRERRLQGGSLSRSYVQLPASDDLRQLSDSNGLCITRHVQRGRVQLLVRQPGVRQQSTMQHWPVHGVRHEWRLRIDLLGLPGQHAAVRGLRQHVSVRAVLEQCRLPFCLHQQRVRWGLRAGLAGKSPPRANTTREQHCMATIHVHFCGSTGYGDLQRPARMQQPLVPLHQWLNKLQLHKRRDNLHLQCLLSGVPSVSVKW